ncbi:G-type lectin S-receptor-like serine/threonine-protein kinase LECRK3 isoform X2 [Jatropha curcas]|uniref:G-type lectin S-receptor-like serine/threonine-protein kinase LECRK3 isoform X2 n=1 Tax=Jatropha curcas TaxID=180498 RepID=UPI0009D75A63|nr:G-type lectin S-receptor-like serine/threonine-protein kinase LECRK3 isoform X2 [Jatropha curcas]
MAGAKLVLLTLCYLLYPIFGLENITLSSSLTANYKNLSSWLSPSGDFAFGFQKLKNTNLFLLAIWFDQIPEKTIIWSANGDNATQEGSRLELTAKGLVLTDPNGVLLWKTEIDQTENVSHAAILNTGNLVLVSNYSSFNLWESFKNPTDTILPSQILESETSLYSRLTETDFSRGRFELYFDNGDLKLAPLAWPTKSRYPYYFSSGTSANGSNSGNKLVFEDIFIVKADGLTAQLQWVTQESVASVAGNYYRATLDYNGVLTKYVYPRGSVGDRSWSIAQYIPLDICTSIFNNYGSGACGYNSYCSMINGRPNCTCPPGYSFMDGNNLFGGCKPNFPLGCGVEDESEKMEELYEIKELPNVNWPLGDYERLEPYSEAECRTSCLQDCSCAVAIYGTLCWKKRLPLGNGRVEMGASKALVKIRKGAPLDYPGPICTNKKQETNLPMFSYQELEEATDNFKEELGRGSSAIVYKGNLKFGSSNVVAIKKLDKLTQEADREFRTEMKAIGRTCHKNLVRLVGFCEEGTGRLLVYEFMTNGTLANFLLGVPKPGWNTRAKIALEVAKGLVYLHEDCETPIIHCDIKPENILLDDCFTARISDFGLAKLLASNQSRTLTIIRGTRGYVAPEWFRNVAVTAKVDVYSYGVMLLEIICCRKNVPKRESEEGILTDWVCDSFMDGRVDDVVASDEEIVVDKDRLYRWVAIAILCIQEDPSKRPSMKMVLQMLEGYVEVPLPPRRLFSSSF